jgi:glycosyltransferase involved in cell wall biosynthesis
MGNSGKAKILFVLPGLDAGGAERVAITLMNGLPRDRYIKLMAAVNATGPLRTLIGEDAIFNDLKAKNILHALPALYALWKKERPDIVFSTLTHMNFIMLFLKSFFPATRVIVRESTMPSYFFATYKNLAKFIKAAYRVLYRKADVIIAPSCLTMNELRALPGMKDYNYSLLYNPVIERIDTSYSGMTTIGKDKRIEFISIGRLDAQKGLDILIPALKDNSFSFTWHWKIVGEGPQRQMLEDLIKQSGLSKNISLENYTPNPSLYYKNADSLLLPSRWEGMPNVVLEALSFGTPVIALKSAGGISEIASMSDKDIVRVASNVTDFVSMMEDVKTKTSTQSLLPSVFTREAVFSDFESILRNLR